MRKNKPQGDVAAAYTFCHDSVSLGGLKLSVDEA